MKKTFLNDKRDISNVPVQGNKFIMILNNLRITVPNLIAYSKTDKDTSLIIFILKNILKC